MKHHNQIYIAALVLLSACRQNVATNQIINQKASIPTSFQLEKMKVITSSVNKRQHTMSTLYGNSTSVKRARLGSPLKGGEMLVLVTWEEKPDGNWYGASTPGTVKSVEQVTTGMHPNQTGYHLYIGPRLTLQRDTLGQNSRINAIFGMQASIMP